MPEPIVSLSSVTVKKNDERMMDPRNLSVETGHNPRNFSLPANIESLERIKESIRSEGVKQPIWVRLDKSSHRVVIIDGETRWRACMALIAEGVDIVSVPTRTVTGSDNEQQRFADSLTANSTQPLSKGELGDAYRRFQNWGWDDDRIAKKMGRTARFVREAIELAESPEEVKAMVGSGQVSEAHAIQQVRKLGGSGAVSVIKAKVAASGGKKVARAKAAPKPGEVQKATAAILEELGDAGPEDQYVSVPISALLRLKKAVGL